MLNSTQYFFHHFFFFLSQREDNYQGNNVQNIQKQLTKLLQLERKINLALSANGSELSEKEEKLLKRQWESIQIEKKCMTEANKRNRAVTNLNKSVPKYAAL